MGPAYGAALPRRDDLACGGPTEKWSKSWSKSGQKMVKNLVKKWSVSGQKAVKKLVKKPSLLLARHQVVERCHAATTWSAAGRPRGHMVAAACGRTRSEPASGQKKAVRQKAAKQVTRRQAAKKVGQRSIRPPDSECRSLAAAARAIAPASAGTRRTSGALTTHGRALLTARPAGPAHGRANRMTRTRSDDSDAESNDSDEVG